MLKVMDYLVKEKISSEVLEEVQRAKQVDSQIRFKRSDDNLELPENFKIGQAIGGGDCFFDSVAQGLKRLKPEMDFTVKSLREVCKKFAQSQLENDQSWFKEALRNEAEPIIVYVSRIEFTANDIEQKSGSVNVLGLTSPIWGRSEIEGRIICKEYNVKLHIVEKHVVEGKEVWLDQIVNSEGSKPVNSIDYNEENTIHIINRGNAHFEPILSTQEIQYNKQQSPDPSDYDDEITPEEELINIIKSRDSEEEKLTKIGKLFEKEPKPDINFQGEDKDTPLHIAVRKKELKIIEWLVKNEAKIDIKNSRSRTPLDIAKRLKRQDIVQILKLQIHPNLQASVGDNQQTGSSVQQRSKQKSDKIDDRGIKRPGKQGLHGEIYQLKLLMLFLKRGVDNQYSFRLSTEKKEAKKFDDLFFEITRDGKKEYRLLQAKHKDDESKKITFDNLLTESDSDYSLVKYFFSYQDSKKEKLFKNGVIKDVTLCTNINLDLGDKHELNGISRTIEEVVQKVEDSDNILDVDSKTLAKEAVRYRFSDDLALLLKPKLEDYNLTRLARRLAECFLKNNSIQHHQAQDIFKLYHIALAEEVIDVKAKKFHDKFIKNKDISEDAKKFREALAKEIKKQSKEGLKLEDINLAISDKRRVIDDKSVDLKLSKNFGNGEDKSWPNNAISDEDVKDFLDHLVFAVNQPNEEQLGKIIENDISKEFNFAARDYVYNELFVKMLSWLNGKGEEFISYQNGKSFFDEVKQKLSELELTGLTLECKSKVEKFGIKFNSDAVQEIGLDEFLSAKDSNKQVFNAITQQNTLSAIKVYQVLQNIYEQNYIFMQLNSILHLQDRVIQAFEGSSNLLVIECKAAEKNVDKLYSQLFEVIQSNSNKKIILITQENDPLASKFKDNFSENNKYEEKKDERNSLIDLTDDSQQKLLEEGKVIFQGEEVSLGTLIDDGSKHLIGAGVLSKLINNNEKIEIDKAPDSLGEIKYYYIDRIFNRRIEIKSEYFKEKGIQDLFVISNIEENELSSLTHGEKVRKFRNNGRDVQDPTRFIILDDDENVQKKLKQLYRDYQQYNIHWLKKEDDKFIWQESQGILSNLRKFLDKSGISEYQVSEVTSIADRVVIISAEPGMGKSTVLTKLAQKTKKSDPSLWVIRINLNDHTDNLNKISFSKNQDQAIDFLSNIVDLKTPLEQELLKRRINDQGKIALLFDGFDEISPTYKEKVIELLKILKDTKVEKLWITTRPYMKDELEDKLSVLSYTLKPLSRDDQKKFLERFWSKKLDLNLNTGDNHLNIYVEKLLNVLSNSIADKEVEFTGIPLQTRMLAEAFQDNLKEFYDSDQGEPNLPKKLDLVDLYQRFIDKKYNIYSEEKKKQNPTNVAVEEDNAELRKSFIRSHQKAALYRLFEKSELGDLFSNSESQEVSEFITKVRDGREKTGIIYQVINDNLSFIHRTFAEYFAAYWLADNQEKQKVKDFFLGKMFKGENEVLRNFFDRILAHDERGENKYEIHNAVLNEDKKKVQELLLDSQKAIDSLDKGGRTALHLAAAYGYKEIVQDLLNYGADVAKSDKVLNWSPLRYADKGNYWGIGELLLKKGADGNDMVEAKSAIKSTIVGARKETLLHIAAEKNYIEFAKVMVKEKADVVNAIDRLVMTPLHVAAAHGNLDVVEFLVEEGADVNAKDEGEFTPLNWTAELGVYKFLVENGADVDAAPTHLERGVPLHNIAYHGKLDIVKYLIEERGADVNAKTKDGRTPLHVAAYGGNLDVVKFLVEKGADVLDIVLHQAVSSGNEEVISLILDKIKEKDPQNFSEHINAKDTKGNTPLMWAAKNGKTNVAKILLEYEADLNAQNNDGETALHWVTKGGYQEFVQLLLEKQANPNIQDNNRKTPLELAKEKLDQDPENENLKAIIWLLLSVKDESQHRGEQGSILLEECLPNSRRKREAESECLFTWEDVDEFNAEKDEKRDFSKIKIDSEKFIDYIKDLPEGKRSQLIQLADKVQVTGQSQGLINKLIGNQKIISHLNRVGRISGMTMHGMMAKNVLSDFLNGDYQGVAINVGFIAGGQGFAEVAEAASLKGLKLASEGKLLLGRSLRAASPFLARGTSAFVIYDLVNQVKAFKNGTEEALVGVVGDSIYLGVDAAEIGIEIAEAFEVLEGVSSVTGPVGATIGAVVFVGTDIYMAVKRVDKIDEIVHLTGKEKFAEGLRAFIGMQPEEHIQELMQEKQVSNQLVRQGLEYLKQHNDIQSYVFPTGKLVVDSCRKVPYKTSNCASGGFGGECLRASTVTRYAEECTTKFEVDLDNTVLLYEKRNNIKWSRARPDDPSGGKLFCLPRGNHERVPSYGSYLCENAIGITDLSAKTGNHTLINLGEGTDHAKGFIDSPNIFVVNNGSKRYFGGNKDDIFILQGSSIKGYFYGEGGINTLDLTSFAPEEGSIDVKLHIGQVEDYYRNNFFGMSGINKFLGRKAKADQVFITCDSDTSDIKFVDGQSGSEEFVDHINIHDKDCAYEMQVVVRSNTIINNRALKGDFHYIVPYALGSAKVDFIYTAEALNLNNTFVFEYEPTQIKNVDVRNINVLNKTSHIIAFNFSPMSDKEFNITISGASNPSYRLGNNTEIKVGNKGNLYMLENANKSVDKIIRDYLVVANRLNRMSFFIQSLLSNETVAIGSGNYEVIHNNPLQKSHLVGNGGENVYVIDSERFETPLPEVVIYDLDVESSVDTIDLRNLIQQARGEFSSSFKLQVLKSANDLLLKATVEKSTEDSSISKVRGHEYFTVRLKDGVNWYNKTHVIMDNVPMRISLDSNEWSLKPQPLMFEKDKEVIVVTSQDIEENTELITPKRAGNYTFVRDHGSDLIITNAFNTQDDLCTIVLSKFYETPKMETLSIKFADKEIVLKDKQKEINAARDVDIVKREHKKQVYSDVFNRSPEIMLSDQPHRHEHSRQHIRNRRMVSSSAKPSSWINDLFGWVKSSISELLSSNTTSSISQVDGQIDVDGAIMLLDLLVRKVTGQKYISTVDQPISSLDAQGYALNIIEKFEKVLNETAIKSGISVTNLNFDPVAVQSAIVGQIINGRFSEISKTLYSSAKEACPEFKQTGKFLAHLRSSLEGEKEAVLLQQKVEKPSKILDQQVSRKVELSKKPDTFLNGTSVVKGISNVLER